MDVPKVEFGNKISFGMGATIDRGSWDGYWRTLCRKIWVFGVIVL